MNKAKVAGLSALLPMVLPLLAHHGTGTYYDQSKTVRAKGVVKEWVWRNPHSELYLDGKDASGKPVTFMIECGSPGQMAKAGMTRRTFVPGEEAEVEMHPAFANPAAGERTGKVWIKGKEFKLGAREKEQPVEAEE
jgi:hypothetical protein